MSESFHPFITKLCYSFQNKSRLFLVMDFCPNGDLCNHIDEEERFSEEKARFYCACVVLALENLHKRDIIFRDLKPENVLIDDEGFAMLTDFGLSKEGVLEQINGTKSFCGSIAYLAPEMIMKVGHGKAVDWYLLGVLLYEMLVGMPPYFSKNRKELLRNILEAPLKMPRSLSPDAQGLLCQVTHTYFRAKAEGRENLF